MPSHKRIAKAQDPRKAPNSAIAMDCGKEMVAMKVMFDAALEET